MGRRAAIIAYDIVSNSRRGKVFRCLQRWSLDSQYSVFECALSNGEAEELFLQLTELIDEEEDKLMLAWLDKKRVAQAVTKGANISFQRPVLYAS